jgi:Aspartyl protease
MNCLQITARGARWHYHLAVAARIAKLIGRHRLPVLLTALSCIGAQAAIESQVTPPIEQPSEQLSEVIVQAAEPRLVAPTRRDRIGRIWAPVYINDRGPFRLVLDSGANHSGINTHVAEVLGLPPDQTRQVLLRGVTGSTTVSTVRVDSFLVGDILFGTSQLPIVTDPLGGADGILGTDGMSGRRIVIDFRHDLITIQRSHNEHAEAGFRTIPFQLVQGNLLQVDASVGGVRTKAIIDTGGQTTIANLALRQALERRSAPIAGRPDTITGVTTDVQEGDAVRTPPLVISPSDRGSAVEIRYHDITFGDMRIFEHWHMTHEPTMLVGMDALGLLDMLIIDYRRHELQIRMRDAG